MSNQPYKMESGRFREPFNRAFEQWQRSFPIPWRLLIQKVWMLLLSSLVTASCTSAQSPQTLVAQQGFCFQGTGVNLPIGSFLLIRLGEARGALRITAIRPSTSNQTTGQLFLGTVDYESYFLPKAGTPSAFSLANKGTGQLQFGPMKGFEFHFRHQTGNHKAAVGPWKFLFFDQDGMFMTAINFWNGIEVDRGFEFAPTNASEVTELNPTDPHLQWYGYDRERDIPCPVPNSAGKR